MPLIIAALMIILAVVASQSVLRAFGRVQDVRLSETARPHVEGLAVALWAPVQRQEVWKVQ